MKNADSNMHFMKFHAKTSSCGQRPKSDDTIQALWGRAGGHELGPNLEHDGHLTETERE
jgi:hypothetical protein